jgi:ribonuclease HI
MPDSAVLRIHTDGASRGNPGPAAFAYVIARDGEEPIEEAGRIGRMTNNQAEYTAVVRALEHALELGAEHRVILHSDSELLVKQMKGEYRVKNPDLRGLYEEARDLVSRFSNGVSFRHVPREQNSRADALGNEALDGKREPTPRASHFKAAAPATPKVSAPSSPPVPASAPALPPLRAQAVACLERARTAWASGAGEPSPAEVWQQLLGLLQKQGVEVPARLR